jgi:uncharacterized protein (UPF0128 family)
MDMTKHFEDCFYNSYIEARKREGKNYMSITAEADNEMTQVFLEKKTLKQFIEHLQKIHDEM